MRNGLPPDRATTSTVSRWLNSVGPAYHRIDSLSDVTLSPRSAEIGMQVTSVNFDVRSESAISGAILSNTPLVPIDEIHLVDGQHDVADSHQRHDVAVPEGLGQQAFASIDQQHGELRRRSRCRHVASVLFVTWRISDDEAAATGRKIAISDVDRDALLAFRLQPVDQQGEIELTWRGGAEAQRIGGKRHQLILVKQTAIKQQPADQRRFAVVNRAAGEKPQQPAICRFEQFVTATDVSRTDIMHQKYPACFFRSIAAS